MAQTVEQRLKELKKTATTAQNEKIRLETKLEEAKDRRKEAVKRVKDKGIDPKNLKDVIEEKEQELETVLAEIESHLPGEEDDADDDDNDSDEDDE